jgi:hypothetical protein
MRLGVRPEEPIAVNPRSGHARVPRLKRLPEMIEIKRDAFSTSVGVIGPQVTPLSPRQQPETLEFSAGPSQHCVSIWRQLGWAEP